MLQAPVFATLYCRPLAVYFALAVRACIASAWNFLKKAGAKVLSFVRINVGEGIEKKEENFAEEVMKQVQASK